MASLRDLKRRIKSVSGIRQITKAMEMVSATKLRRAQSRIQQAKPYTSKMDEILAHLGDAVKAGVVTHPLLNERPEVNNLLIISVASDKGLCGSFNSNVFRLTEQRIRQAEAEGLNVSLLLVGKKSFDYFKRRKYTIRDETQKFLSIDQELPMSLLQELTNFCTKGFLAGEFDQVEMVYTDFITVISSRAVQRQFLPIKGLVPENDDNGESESKGTVKDYIFEPDAGNLLLSLIPKYARVVVFRILASSLASEHGQRMSAMKNATDNAGDMIKTLTLQRNKARQAAITTELSEIVGGAEALKG
ncbi:MAG TPA: ATP synthase F1 subunit gamma [bacterium]|jgi:F-type H+-transporting ATPase subunit gamma